jgi:hypothetical protein
MSNLPGERKNQNFDALELGHYIYGGKERYDRIMKIYSDL